MNKKKIIGALVALLVILVGAIIIAGSRSSATENDDPQVCYGEPVIDQPAWDEVVPGEPSLWWNWSPNKDQGPFDGPPAFPTDERGTWQGPHNEGGPGQDQVGTFQQGNGHGSWFHREAGTPDTTIHHDATYKDVVVPCEEEVPPTEEPPVVNPPKDNPPAEKPPVKTPTKAPEAGLPNTGA